MNTEKTTDQRIFILRLVALINKIIVKNLNSLIASTVSVDTLTRKLMKRTILGSLLFIQFSTLHIGMI